MSLSKRRVIRSRLLSMLAATLILPVLAAFCSTPPRLKNTHVQRPAPGKKLLMAHYMPWFQAKPFAGEWGWHWTMGHLNPDHTANSRPDAASHYRPLIGLYDSSDPDVLQCQALLMKLAGIDGVIFDWYGNDHYYDYAENNRNTQQFVSVLQQDGLHFAICYEDQTVPKEIAGGLFTEADAVPHGQRLMQWMQQNYFSSSAYLKLDNRPVFLTFGKTYYNDDQWTQIFSVLPDPPFYFTESHRQEPTASAGGFYWPQPGGGTASSFKDMNAFYQEAASWPSFIAAAYPRFEDFYQEAGISKSWGHIDDRNGETYRETLDKALQSTTPIVQLVTWNDWGEGTQIEPSEEYGYRDLETTQAFRRKYLDTSFSYTKEDLRLPVKWLMLRKKYQSSAPVTKRLDAFISLINAGHISEARTLLNKYR